MSWSADGPDSVPHCVYIGWDFVMTVVLSVSVTDWGRSVCEGDYALLIVSG